MGKIVKIKELKSKVKVLGEVKKSEGDKEIERLTKGEIPVDDAFAVGASSPFRLDQGPQRAVGRAVPRPSVQERPGVPRREMTGSELYGAGKTMGGAAGKASYKPVETIGTAHLRTVGVGKDFAMGGSGGGAYADANRIESGLRDATSEKNYSTQVEAGAGKKSKKYAWDV
ncbi:MAG: hypothetical protein ABH864_04905 [archaeon]